MIVEYSGCVSGLKRMCCGGGVACLFFVSLLYPLHCYEILIKILSKLKIFSTKPATSLECHLTEFEIVCILVHSLFFFFSFFSLSAKIQLR